ncbi:hypothetical protein BDN70DRAFT_814377 [Pholiota conissans]|uniref:Uncharacterized protein n=1 Tax=Pholiota conissans TaxID=109636 RepID=A0A9P5YUA7_9AGAR|nr:hypothetical protein BDN70DRAFT_814377 [Pholiota conissans]
MVPSANHFPLQQGSQNQPQSSPTIPTTGARRSPPLGAVARVLPTPPQPNPPAFTDDRRLSPPPGPQQSHSQPNVNAHYARPSPRAPTAAYPNKLHHLEEFLEMTPELMADIERADQQQYQSVQPGHPYSYGPGPRGDGDSPPSGKGINSDRARGPPERTSPTNPDNAQQQRGWRDQQQLSRDSPKARDRPPASPNVSPFTQGPGQSHTPERRNSPAGHVPIVIPGEPHPASYLAQFANREQPILRRAPNSEPRLPISMASGQTPPLQNIPTRAPGRSLPVQEEDEVTAKNNGNGHQNWQLNDQAAEKPFHSTSPTPSSDLEPDGSSQRYDTAASHNNQLGLHDEDEDKPLHKHEDNHKQYAERDSNEDDATYTPKSPSAGLPEGDRDAYYPKQIHPPANPVLIPPRTKARNGSTDHVMLGLESALKESSPPDAPPPQTKQPERPAQYSEQRQQTQSNGNHYQNYPPQQEYLYDQELYRNGHGLYPHPQVYPDDFQGYGEDATSAYIRAYLNSPRPDAPIPPTPHSQTAAPSPSPLLSGYGPAVADLPSSYRMRTAGSPYPFPFTHVLRNRQLPGRFLPGAMDQHQQSVTEQVARQWQIFAQNNHQGNVTDSTLSPRGTPFQPDMYNQWAYLHTQRMMPGVADTASIQSSPSHQPVPLPLPPTFIAGKKKNGLMAKRRNYDRKPPPRVESTQPRETSPELSSSGEETSTAGEERPNSVQPEQADANSSSTAAAPTVADAEANETSGDDSGDWIDEDEDDEYEDLLDMEYHPSFVRNMSKRRRKWEVGWENLIQAFQTLDRTTDATMILMASPSHSTKLHSLRSRSIRRSSFFLQGSWMRNIRGNFRQIVGSRRMSLPDQSSMVDRLVSPSTGGDASDGSTVVAEENLRRALDVALGSLGAMGEVYEQREARVLEELQRAREEREKLQLILRQILGDNHPVDMSSLFLWHPRTVSKS